MKHTSLASMDCAIARTLDAVGEWWSLLIIRDAFLGARRFEEFKASGMADNILAARLKRLTAEGILERRPYQARPVRHEYVLTEKGHALLPVIAALREWGKIWTTGPDARPPLIHEACGHTVTVALTCPHCKRNVAIAEVRAGDGSRAQAAVGADA
ncbi:MAG TPA: helix-turn-helix domain-containing protein [Ktedonobacterales bacterium]